MQGRQYDPKLGQFVQPDPIVQAPDFSQSWNRYAYVFNNPLKFVDPTGYQTSGSGEGSGSSDEGEGEPSYQGERAYGPIVVNPQVYRMGATHHTRTGSVASETSRATAPVDFGMESIFSR
jgi:uncharacterized protein RhaS with RHS repeats